MKKPILNQKYTLMVKRHKTDNLPTPCEFEYLACRGSKYYFHCSDYGLDRLLSKSEFNRLLKE